MTSTRHWWFDFHLPCDHDKAMDDLFFTGFIFLVLMSIPLTWLNLRLKNHWNDFAVNYPSAPDVEAPLKERRCWISTEWTWLNYGPWTTIGFCKSGLLLKAAEGLGQEPHHMDTDGSGLSLLRIQRNTQLSFGF